MHIKFTLFLLTAMLGLLGGCSSLKKNPIYTRRAQPGDITLGMKKRSVYGSWGEPAQVYTAGYESENEKWIYPIGTTHYGLGAERVVYFENGVVIGWETKNSDSYYSR
ncbi:MAG: hypothetical protein CL678_09485 [Bdellovibrionaceae bacterium]|nr:hypothetical protein [Pseudobdellovibrionaceae bacterium]|tara:strand:+ start:1451 stop:1774 length:324 start_codon:yes stop_codon:yes gene_type:complete